MSLQNLTGRTIGQYELRQLYGEGGMGAVYLAYQHNLERDVAFKVMSLAIKDDPQYVQRFTQEAKLSASLEHPHIVPVFDYGTTDEVSYVAMRLLTGGSLSDRLRDLTGNPVTLEEMADLLKKIGSALDYAHSKGVIHRDIKASNIMFDQHQTPYLVDFGVAKLAQEVKSLTVSGSLIGTPTHMAPEQWQSAPLTGAVDQYALGVLVYELLTGDLPFHSDTAYGLMLKHLNEAPPQLSTGQFAFDVDIAHRLMAVLTKVLAKDPNDRYDSVSAFAAAFDNAVAGRTSDAVQPTPHVVNYPKPLDARTTAGYPGMAPSQGAAADPHVNKPTTHVSPEEVSGALDIKEGNPTSAINVDGNQTTNFTDLMKRQVAELPSGRARGLIAVVLSAIAIGGVAFYYRPALPTDSDSSAAINSISGNDSGAAPPAPNQPDGVALPTPTSSVRADDHLYALANTMLPWVSDIHFSPDGSTVAAASTDGSIQLWDWETVRNTNEDDPPVPSTVLFESFEAGPVLSMTYNPAGTLIAAGYGDGLVRTWLYERNMTFASICHSGDTADCGGALVYDLAYHPAMDAVIATAGSDGYVRLWRQEGSRPPEMVQELLHTEGSPVLAMAFTEDGSLLATGGQDGTVVVWDAATWERLDTLEGHAAAVWDVAFSPDGGRLISGSEDQTVRLWNSLITSTSFGASVQTFTGHTDAVLAVSFSQNAQVFPASVGADRTIRFWDVATGESLLVHQDERIVSNLLSLDFRPDDTAFVFGCANNIGSWAIFSWQNVLSEGTPVPDQMDSALDLEC